MVFEQLSTFLEGLPHKRRRENPKAKPLDLPLEKPKPVGRVKMARLPYVALFYCDNCKTFWKGL